MSSSGVQGQYVDPPLWRVVLGFAVAPAAVLGPLALIVALVELAIGASSQSSFAEAILYFLFVYAYPTAFVVGIPAYVLYRKRIGRSATDYFILGASVSSATWCLIIFLAAIALTFSTPSKTADEVAMIFGFAVGLIGGVIIPLIVLGGVSGVLFWKVAIPSVKRPDEVLKTVDPGAA